MRHFNWVIIFILVFAFLGSTALAKENPYVLFQLSAYSIEGWVNYGSFLIELYPDKAPITVDNFLDYVKSGFYEDSLVHRVENRDEFGQGLDVIQMGGYFDVDPNTPPEYRPAGDPIINESYNGLSNLRGTIAMARKSDPDSASSQFFINHQDNIELDRENSLDGYGYCVFGTVLEGWMGFVDNIAQIQTDDKSAKWGPVFANFPVSPTLKISSAFLYPCGWSYCMDFTGDGRIGLDDFAIFASHWLGNDCDSANGFCDGADLDFNGMVDITDLDFFLYHWAQPAGYEFYHSDLIPSGSINLDDLAFLMAHWLDSGCDSENGYCEGADIDHSGTVDMVDYYLLSSHWLETSSSE